jgi:hypothetical protein
MSYVLELLIALLLGGALGLWIGCRYGCEGIRTFFARCKSLLIGLGKFILYAILIAFLFVILVITIILWVITECIEWLRGLPWRRWWESLRWLWWLLGALLLLLAALLAFLGFIPAAIGLALLALFLLFTLLGLIGSLIVILLGMLAWFADVFQALAKWIAAFLAGLSLTLPTCSDVPSAPTPPPQAAIPAAAIPPRVTEEKTCTIVPIEKGDGAIRATARGGHALGLAGSIEWTRTQGLPARRVGRYIHAPTLYTSDHIEWCDDKGWILVRPSQR